MTVCLGSNASIVPMPARRWFFLFYFEQHGTVSRASGISEKLTPGYFSSFDGGTHPDTGGREANRFDHVRLLHDA